MLSTNFKFVFYFITLLNINLKRSLLQIRHTCMSILDWLKREILIKHFDKISTIQLNLDCAIRRVKSAFTIYCQSSRIREKSVRIYIDVSLFDSMYQARFKMAALLCDSTGAHACADGLPDRKNK